MPEHELAALLLLRSRPQAAEKQALHDAVAKAKSRLASVDGCCRLRLSSYVLPGTAAVSGTFFANPINLQLAGTHVIFVDSVS
jgi:hypothetical protein